MSFHKSPWFGFDAFFRLTGGQAWENCMKHGGNICGKPIA